MLNIFVNYHVTIFVNRQVCKDLHIHRKYYSLPISFIHHQKEVTYVN